MVNHSGENNDFKRLQKLGMKFGDGGDYTDQSDSGSAIGGNRGENEYGIRGGVARETSAHDQDPLHPSEMDASVDDFSDREEQPNAEPIPLGKAARDFPGVSEYSEESAMEPEDIIANRDVVDTSVEDAPLTPSKPRTKTRSVKSPKPR